MVDSERRRVITSTPHLSPDEIRQRAFPTSFRGFAESDVRAFLKRVAEEVVLLEERQAELLDTIDSLEEQLRSPRPLSEPEMLAALGSETTRLLQSARETADELRVRGEERAARLVEEARERAEHLRAEAEEHLRARSEEAAERAAEVVAEAETRAAELCAVAEEHAAELATRTAREAEELLEVARRDGREMLDEAKATRERVLSDLLRRRGLLAAQIDALRGGRDGLLDAYRVVKRTFLEATEALAQVEARAAAERAAGTAEALAGAEPIDDGEAADGWVDAQPDEVEVVEIVVEAVDEPAGETAPGTGPDDGAPGEADLADVDSLFARIRAGQAEAAAAPASADAVALPSRARGGRPAATDAAHAAGPPGSDGAVIDVTRDEPDARRAATAPALAAWRARRAEVIDPLLARLSKQAKRAAQDDQNALLDAVRRHKGRPRAAQVLREEAELRAAWSSVIAAAVDEAYGAGRVAAGGDAADADAALAAEAAATIVVPLRDRIATAIDTGDDGDTGGLVERIGARFREWKNQSLESALADVLSAAWSRGVYDAAPDGAVLHWIPVVEGRCADCDDNRLEPTVKGASFPTGQAHPPAHPGCRCLLAPAEVLSGLTANA